MAAANTSIVRAVGTSGYPDFKEAGLVKQEVDIGEFKATRLILKKQMNWHLTAQEISKIILGIIMKMEKHYRKLTANFMRSLLIKAGCQPLKNER